MAARGGRPLLPTSARPSRPSFLADLPPLVWSILGLILLSAILAAIFAAVSMGLAIGDNNDDNSDVIRCDVLIIGGGPGGLVMGYRLAPIFGRDACIIDDRTYWGGKVYSEEAPNYTPEQPLETPTCAEQFRAGDVGLRCLARERGIISESRASPMSHLTVILRGMNATGVECYGTSEVTGPADCDNGYIPDRLGPNGDLPVYPNAPNFCGEDDWRTCSSSSAYLDILMDPNNVATIVQGETMESYAKRILGDSGSQLARDLSGYPYAWSQPTDAKAYIDYINYDFEYSYAHLLLPVNGPQALWKSVAGAIEANGTRMFLNTKATSISRGSKTRYAVKTSDHRVFHVTGRIVIAIPPLALRELSGDLATELSASKYVKYSGHNAACTANIFFESNWWAEDFSTCNAGYCAQFFSNGSFTFDRNGTIRDFAQWSGIADDPPFWQYIATRERKAMHLIRFFYEDETCAPYKQILETDGQEAVTAEVMRRFRNTMGSYNVPDPLEGFFRFEESAYQLPSPGWDFTFDRLFHWASQPIEGERICFATEGLNPQDSGWQEGALDSAHRCLRGRVFDDVITSEDVDGFERCSNAYTERELIKGDEGTFDLCLLLENEYSMRDLAGLNFCGGPSVLPSGITSQSSAADSWANAVDTPVLNQDPPKRLRSRYFA